MAKITKRVMSNLQCPECGNVAHIQRPKGLRRSNQHVKHLWCFKCKKETGHIEQREEYNLFNNEINQQIPSFVHSH